MVSRRYLCSTYDLQQDFEAFHNEEAGCQSLRIIFRIIFRICFVRLELLVGLVEDMIGNR